MPTVLPLTKKCLQDDRDTWKAKTPFRWPVAEGKEVIPVQCAKVAYEYWREYYMDQHAWRARVVPNNSHISSPPLSFFANHLHALS